MPYPVALMNGVTVLRRIYGSAGDKTPGSNTIVFQKRRFIELMGIRQMSIRAIATDSDHSEAGQ
jgi:hypothetical protein